MRKKASFRDTIQVDSKDILNIEKAIQQLELDSRKYNGTKQSKSTVDIFRSGQMMAFDALLSAGLLFKLYETCGKTMDAHIITRVKSQASIEEKKKRIGRNKGKELGDIIGSSLIADRVHNYTEINTIFNSPEIQTRYNERQSNIRLLKEVSKFIIDLNSDENNIASDLDDNYSKNNHELVSRLNTNKKDCRAIIKNCNIYLQESKTPKGERFPINRTFKSMCRYLINEEIQRAYDSIKETLKREEQNKQEVESQLQELIQYRADEKQKIDMLKSLLVLQNQKIVMTKQQIKLLRRNVGNKNITQLKILLSSCLNTKRIELLEQIDKHVSKQIDEGEKKDQTSVEKRYCQYLAIVLYQIKRLEFVNDKDTFKGKIYETIEHSLYTQLEEYRDAEIGGHTYKSITFNDVQKLTTNLRRLNSRLSDRLQHDILDYSLQLYLNNVIKQFTGECPSNPDFKIKKNGYVATHIDIDMIRTITDNQLVKLKKELKLITHHRDLESTTGSAAYGSGRQENMEAKTRKIEFLEKNIEDTIKSSKGPKTRAYKFHGNTTQQLDKARNNNYLAYLISNYSDISESQFVKSLQEQRNWQRKLFSVIPRYSQIRYDSETDSVIIEFFSDYDNVKKYYTETNLPIKRKKTLEMLGKLKEDGKISDKTTTIQLTHSQYRYFIRNNLEQLKSSIINLYLDVLGLKQNTEVYDDITKE